MLRPWCQTFNGSPVKFHLSPFEMLHSEVTILELERCGFLPFEVYLVPNNSFLFFSIRTFFAPSVDFFKKNFFQNFQKLYLNFF